MAGYLSAFEILKTKNIKKKKKAIVNKTKTLLTLISKLALYHEISYLYSIMDYEESNELEHIILN